MPLLEVKNLKVHFPVKHGMFSRVREFRVFKLRQERHLLKSSGMLPRVTLNSTEWKIWCPFGLPKHSILCRTRSWKWWLGAESNRRHKDFQSSALPTELPSHRGLTFN
jgi:hypothetical protein